MENQDERLFSAGTLFLILMEMLMRLDKGVQPVTPFVTICYATRNNLLRRL